MPSLSEISEDGTPRSLSYRSAEVWAIGGLLLALGVAVGMLVQAKQVAQLQAGSAALEARLSGLESAIERLSHSFILASGRISELETLANNDEASQQQLEPEQRDE